MSRWILAVSIVAAGCNPVFEPVVEQTAQALTGVAREPRVVWVLDNSGSLLQPIDVASPACPAGCGNTTNLCPASCATRKSVLQSGLSKLATQMPAARNASIVYPIDNTSCGSPGVFEQSFPVTASKDSLALIASRYLAHTPSGGTPTSATLEFVAANLTPEPDAETFVVLVTDGLPNCNIDNPNNQCNGPNPACICTTSNCTGALCSLGCLDDLGIIDASRRLAQRDAKLMVVGLGADVTGAGSAVLSSLDMSLPRLCQTTADCRTGSFCLAEGVCSERFYTVSSEQDFAAPATRIKTAVAQSSRCGWWLEHEVVAADLSVVLDGQPLDVSSWSVDGSRRVRVSGDACDRLIADPALTPAFMWKPGSGP